MRLKRLVVLLAAVFPALFLSATTSAQHVGDPNSHAMSRGHGVGLSPGTVSSTANPQVALYTLTLPLPGSWSVRFGLTTDYGRTTSIQTVDEPGRAASMYVAGMLPNTTYHMQATVTLKDGSVATDGDQTFTTGSLPPGIPARFPVTPGVTGTPQPGIELVNLLSSPSTVLATDLRGNVIWTYPFPDRINETSIYPARLMPDGHVIIFICPSSSPLGLPGANIMREIDLAGNVIRELSMEHLNAALAKAGFNITLANYSHDFVLLPNGHYLILVTAGKNLIDLPGYPGQTTVVGDVVVDLDPSWNPVWAWNSFDHLDVNRHPMQFPDWTHGNSVEYSADDGNFIISLRHQNWVLKIDYRDGKGTGDILWKLGEGGNFKLQGGVDPTDWFYAQHDARYITPNSTGKFRLSLMDNGDDREFPDGVTCGVGNGPACLYSTVPVLEVDEAARTATVLSRVRVPDYLYSSWGGNVELLPNGNTEFNLSGSFGGSVTEEVTSGPNPQPVWLMAIPNGAAYRAYRIPSLYPGVQW